jgi:hypothetical protein
MPTVALSYHVQATADVDVSAEIGDAQGGGHSIFLGNNLVTQGERTASATLGLGQSLIGKVLTVSSVAVDIAPTHDHVSVLIELTGGVPDPMPVPQAADAPANGSVNFLTIVTFV